MIFHKKSVFCFVFPLSLLCFIALLWIASRKIHPRKSSLSSKSAAVALKNAEPYFRPASFLVDTSPTQSYLKQKSVPRQFPHDVKSSDLDSSYLFYHTHSGFSNQVLSLKTALSLAYVTNRTLIMPPLLLGSRCTLDWRPFPILQLLLFDIFNDFQLRSRIFKANPHLTQDERLDIFVDSLFNSTNLSFSCSEDSLTESYSKLADPALLNEDTEDSSLHAIHCVLRRYKFMTNTLKPLCQAFSTPISKKSSLDMLSMRERFKEYQANWQLIPFSKLYNLNSTPAKVIDYFDFMNLIKDKKPSNISRTVVPDFSRYHYQLWDNKEKDLSWRKKLLPPEYLSLNISNPTQRHLFYKTPLPRSAWKEYRYLLKDMSRVSIIETAMTKSDRFSIFGSPMESLYIPEDTSSDLTVHQNGHYLAAIDIANNIDPYLPTRENLVRSNSIHILHVGSLFGTARLRIRQSKYKAGLALIDRTLGKIGYPLVNDLSQSFVQHVLCADQKSSNGHPNMYHACPFLAIHLRGGEGGGFAYHVEQVLDQGIQHFKKSYPCPSATSPDMSCWKLYVATDITDFKSSIYYKKISNVFPVIYDLSDLQQYYHAEYFPKHTNEIQNDIDFNFKLFEPMIEQLISSFAIGFHGTPGSTFSALIQRAKYSRYHE